MHVPKMRQAGPALIEQNLEALAIRTRVVIYAGDVTVATESSAASDRFARARRIPNAMSRNS
jgi:hypothetical protein